MIFISNKKNNFTVDILLLLRVRKVFFFVSYLLFCISIKLEAISTNTILLTQNNSTSTNQNLSVTLISHQNFAPYSITSLERMINNCLDKKLSISIESYITNSDLQDQNCSLDKKVNKSNLLLLDILCLNQLYSANNSFKNACKIIDYFDLVWVIALNKTKITYDDLNKIANISKISDFIEFLNYYKNKLNFSFYPYFESLNSPLTFTSIFISLSDVYKQLIFNESKVEKNKNNEQVISEKLESIASYVNYLIANNLLNPLSLDSNEKLAFEVLSAGDCAVSTLWISEEEFVYSYNFQFTNNPSNNSKNLYYGVLNLPFVYIPFINNSKNASYLRNTQNLILPTYRFALINLSNLFQIGINKKRKLHEDQKFIINQKNCILSDNFLKLHEYIFKQSK